MLANQDFLDETYEKAQASLRLLRSEISPKGLKEFRVAIKRLRAFAMLIDFVQEQSNVPKKHRSQFVKQLKQFKTVFGASGGLRDTELSVKFLEKYEALLTIQCPEYKSFLQSENHRHLAEFRKSFRSMNRLVYLKTILKIVSDYGNQQGMRFKEQTRLWMKERYREYQLLLQDIHEEEDIHNLRKFLKQLYFISELTGIPVPDEGPELKKRLKKIGKWHDRTIFRDKMNDWLSSVEPDMIADPASYEKLLGQIESEARSYLSEAGINFYT